VVSPMTYLRSLLHRLDLLEFEIADSRRERELLGRQYMVFPRERQVSFVWDELSKHMVVSIRSMLLSGHHLLVTGSVSSGESPQTCVSGTGFYKCKFRAIEFELFVRYCEPIGDNRWVFYLDHERNRARRDSVSLSN